MRDAADSDPGPPAAARWTFLTNHARVLLAVSHQPDARFRDIARVCGITERAAQGIVADLEAEGYLSHERVGRRNRYRIATGGAFRHPAEGGMPVSALLTIFTHREDPPPPA